jgi:hypothetical protein
MACNGTAFTFLDIRRKTEFLQTSKFSLCLVAANEAFENGAKLKYFGATVTNQILISDPAADSKRTPFQYDCDELPLR